MSQDTRVAADPLDVERRDKPGQRLIVLTALAAVIVLDQVTKWWAWRYVSGAKINSGGDVLVGSTVSRWYADPAAGALLDLLDFGLLSIALSILVRRRRPAVVVVSGALFLGGWGSNLLDRLGLHVWIAPGSVRGVVDFIHVGGGSYNVADFFIIGVTPLFLLAVGYLGCGAANRPVPLRVVAPATRNRPRSNRLRGNRPRTRASMPALACAGLIVAAVALGATNYGGVSTRVSTASAHVSAKGN
jgi:lipoprotein signal peptidase